MNAPKVITRNLLVLVTFLFVARLGYTQAIGPTVETPTSRRSAAVVDSSDNITMAGEFKSTKNVQMTEEKKPCWDWYADFGYESEYNFRGTNLTPDADGAIFIDADISRWGFTLGMFAVRQLGIASSPAFSIGEGGGGGAANTLGNVGAYSPETVQKDFSEIDIFLQYHRNIGPIDVTVGDIGFFIDRDAQTFLNTQFFGLFGPIQTVQNEQFDRLFIRLATSVIPHIQPWITYYQTVYNDGEDHQRYKGLHIPPDPLLPPFVTFGDATSDRFHERNDRLGGYLEGRLRGNFALCDWAEFNPYGVISYSFHDRTEPVPDATKFTDIIRGRSLTGFNVAQAGVELPIRLLFIRGYSSGPCAPPNGRLNFVPFGTYSYHISLPPAGTDRDEVFGGAKFALTF